MHLGAGADSVYGAQVISDSTISGGAGQDTFLISTLSDAAIYAGDAADSINITGSLTEQLLISVLATSSSQLTVGASNSTIRGGSGNDTFVVTASNLQTASKIDGGSGNDSVTFGGVLFWWHWSKVVQVRHAELLCWCQQRSQCLLVMLDQTFSCSPAHFRCSNLLELVETACSSQVRYFQ